MTYQIKEINSRSAMDAPSAIHHRDGKFFISSCWIPETYTHARKVYFISDTEGGEYGQFPTLEQALENMR